MENLLEDFPDLTKILLAIKDYYSTNQVDLGSVDNLELYFHSSYPSLRPKEVEAFGILFERLKAAEASPEFVDSYLSQLKRAQLASRLAMGAMELTESNDDLAPLQELLNALKDNAPLTSPNTEFVTDDLNELLDEQFLVPGLKWRLDSLNKSLGSLRKGDFGFIFKRPETGGTTFLASEVTFMAGQTDRPIIWFNNEEQSKKVKLRCYQAALGCTLDNLWKNREQSISRYQLETKGNIWIPPDGSFGIGDIERLVSAYNPALIVFDQIDKIKISVKKEDRRDTELGKLYQWARELAKEYCPIIAVSQASGEAEDRMWLTMDHVADAKTAKQAEADFIIGIGKFHDMSKKNLRYLNISKNKLLGDQETLPEMRHAQITTIIKADIARFEDIE